MSNPILHVIVTVFKRNIQLRQLIDSFLLQTCADWQLHIIHDGPVTPEIIAVLTLYSDPRIIFTETPQVNGIWGHPNRKFMLDNIQSTATDFILITNDDNQYTPVFVEYFLKECNGAIGFVYCDTIHSYMKYDILKTQVKENHIDMGSFIVRADIAKKTGFKHLHISADGKYAEECVANCKRANLKIAYIPKCLFVHN